MDTIGLLVGRYDPATLDHSKAAETLATTKGISQVWLCPLQFTVPDDCQQHVRNMCTILATDMSSAGLPVACCTVALDNKTNPCMNRVGAVLAACRAKFPYYKFRPALVVSPLGIADCHEEQEEDALIFKFSGDDPSVKRGIPVVIRYAPPPAETWKRLLAGLDESRHFNPRIWDYVRTHGVYRQKES